MSVEVSRVRLGQVGLGRWGGVVADAVHRSGVAEIAACYARTTSTRAAFAARVGCREASSFTELVAADDIEGVILITPHSVHAEQVEQAAAAGKHVMVDKPFTLTTTEARRATTAAASAGVVLLVGHQRRRQAANRRIKAMLEDGDIGTPLLAESMFNVARGIPDTWRASRLETPLGGMTGLGVHMIDTYHYLLGPIDRVASFSTGVLAGEPLDHATGLIFEFRSGTVGTILTSHFVPAANRVSVHGTLGAAFNEDDGARLFVQHKSDETRSEVDFEPNDELVEQIAEFSAAIRGSTSVETGGAEGLAVVAVLEAAVASAERESAVSVAEFSDRMET